MRPVQVFAIVPSLGGDEDDSDASQPGDAVDGDAEGFGPLAAEADPGTDAPSPPASPARPVAPTPDDGALCALIEAVVARDERALERLYDATSARVYGLALRITQHSALAEEVVEDTYWQVWRQAPRFDVQRGRPLTWLLAMARTRAIDALRRDQRYAHDELPQEDEAGAAVSAAPPPQDLIDATRADERLHRAVSGLDARSRQLIALAFFRGLTHDEIAQQQGLPLGTVKSIIRRAMQQLRQRMADAQGGGS